MYILLQVYEWKTKSRQFEPRRLSASQDLATTGIWDFNKVNSEMVIVSEQVFAVFF